MGQERVTNPYECLRGRLPNEGNEPIKSWSKYIKHLLLSFEIIPAKQNA